MRRFFKSIGHSFIAGPLVLLALASASILALPGLSFAQQCTDYVSRKCSLPAGPAAYKWASTGWLAQQGYRQVATPVRGAITVYGPGVNNVDSTNGHVGIVEWAYPPDATGTIYFALRSANAGYCNLPPYAPYTYLSDAGCNNVSVRRSSLTRGQTGITFWVK